VVASRELAVPAVGEPRPVGTLEVAVAALPEVFLWEAEWRDESGRLDVERMVATTTEDFGALFDVPAPELAVTRTASGEVRIQNTGEVAALTVRLVDPRPVGARGVLEMGGDPRPLLPGEERALAATPGLPVRVEVWNAVPIEVR
jgi:beta-mannosidase